MADEAQGDVHMIEADVLLRGGLGGNGDPIMAHPPETDSDITLQEWLQEIVSTNKGIKLDFKSLEAVRPSLELLDEVKQHLRRPVWINADILLGPNGKSAVVDAEGFLNTVTSFFPDVTLSLGWTTGWHPGKHNEGYDLVMVKEMAQICSALSQPVTFPVRAALVRQSISELCWLMQQSDRYSLTVWTGKEDVYAVEDLVYIRENFDKSMYRSSLSFEREWLLGEEAVTSICGNSWKCSGSPADAFREKILELIRVHQHASAPGLEKFGDKLDSVQF
ncbi:PREDICTED: protein FAM151B isoform X2 [Calidris pugnax]|uniref:protein FAM151B isoform X2 n=1 Tax=Calidris pugnax TaxID=198806 RepID=UPI00071CA1FD|nr:PREDICTED: protein FAM151B isoform X2 [Calidris pugnax]